MAFVPSDAPEPVAFVEDWMRFAPIDAVFGKRDTRSATDEFLIFVDGAADGEHEAIIRCDGEFWVAEVDAGFFEECCGFPVVAIAGGEDANFAVAGDVALGFAAGAEPSIIETDQVGEGIVVGAGPDFFDGEQFEIGGLSGRYC